MRTTPQLWAFGMALSAAGVSARQAPAAFFGMFSKQGAATAAPVAKPFTPSGGPGLPGIYQGWFDAQILGQVQSATQAAIKAGVKNQEVSRCRSLSRCRALGREGGGPGRQLLVSCPPHSLNVLDRLCVMLRFHR